MTVRPTTSAGCAAAIALALMAAAGPAPMARAADLKQLAEQLVNLSIKETRCRDTRTGREIRVILRNGALVDGAGRPIRDGAALDCGGGRIAIQEEGANVKKEKGVEDVD